MDDEGGSVDEETNKRIKLSFTYKPEESSGGGGGEQSIDGGGGMKIKLQRKV